MSVFEGLLENILSGNIFVPIHVVEINFLVQWFCKVPRILWKHENEDDRYLLGDNNLQ